MTDKRQEESASPSGPRTYSLVSELGRGGYGSVYFGQMRGRSGFTKQVAIKVLNDELQDDESLRARLRDEARLLALLNHRAIVRVEDLAKVGGNWAVVMEYVDGADLEQLVKRGPIPLRPLCEIVLEVAAALHVAHNARNPQTGRPLRIVHRDIKPPNIRITPAGEVKLLDFGVARASFLSREARTGSLAFGTEGYMAPERFDGRDLPEADIYSLAVVFYECALGRRLGQLSVDFFRQKVEVAEALDALQQAFGGGVPDDLVAALSRMLSYYPADRSKAAHVADEFKALSVQVGGPWLRGWASEAVKGVQEDAAQGSDGEPIRPDGVANEPDSTDTMGERYTAARIMGSPQPVPQPAVTEAAVLREPARGPRSVQPAQEQAATGVSRETRGRSKPGPWLTVALLGGAALFVALLSLLYVLWSGYGGAPGAGSGAEGRDLSASAAAEQAPEPSPSPAPVVSDDGEEPQEEPAPGADADRQAATKPSKGYLSVNVTRNWAYVSVDGKHLAETTPVVKHRVTAGWHTVRVRNEALGIDESRSVQVVAGEVKLVLFKLEESAGSSSSSLEGQ